VVVEVEMDKNVVVDEVVELEELYIVPNMSC
jgi:hypothetical protein